MPAPATAPPRLFAAALGLLAGSAAGAAEAIGFAAAQRQYIRSLAESLVVFGTPLWIGGAVGLLGGALVGRWLARAPRSTHLVVLLPFAAAIAALLRWRRTDLAGGAWAYLLGAALLFLVLLAAAPRVLHRRPRAPRRLVFAALLALGAWPLASLAALALAREEPPPIATPRTAGTPAALAADAPERIVLVTWDTVRADVLPLFGGSGLATPHLDRLAAEGLLCERATAVAPITGPAHLSLLTGVEPPRHGLRSNGDPAPAPAAPHLAERLQQAGFATAGFVSNLALMRRSGFDRGFDLFDDRPAAPPLDRLVSLARLGSIFLQRLLPAELAAAAHQTPGEETLARALAWLATAPPRAFLWTHFYDAHAPYSPQEPYASRTRARAAEGLCAVDPRAQADLVAQRGEIEQLDELLGRLRAALERADPGLQRTLLIVVADHGECFGEGGLRGHHQSLLHATQHIPLLVRPHGAHPQAAALAGTRVSEPTSQLDVLPTVLAALSLPAEPEAHGVDLLALAAGGEAPARGFYLEAFQRALGERRQQGWSESGWKYLRDLAGHEQLLRLDAHGREEVVDDPERLALLRARLDAWIADHPAASAAATGTERGALDRADAEALKALGYAEK
ncbi:MAG: sulfatase [Planctomycetes bacterium]|nr:sulfatase [Planctomycetota bacterium]